MNRNIKALLITLTVVAIVVAIVAALVFLTLQFGVLWLVVGAIGYVLVLLFLHIRKSLR